MFFIFPDNSKPISPLAMQVLRALFPEKYSFKIDSILAIEPPEIIEAPQELIPPSIPLTPAPFEDINLNSREATPLPIMIEDHNEIPDIQRASPVLVDHPNETGRNSPTVMQRMENIAYELQRQFKLRFLKLS